MILRSLALPRTLLAALLLSASAGHAAESCDTIRARIDAKVRAGGVTDFALTIVEAGLQVGGKVVGSCDLGTKRIVYTRSALPGAPARRAEPAGDTVITECRDGSVPAGGDCRR